MMAVIFELRREAHRSDMYSLTPRAFVLIACGLACFACGKSRAEESSEAAPAQTAEVAAAPAPAVPPNPGDEAKTVFQSRCAACHGSSGHGDGPGSQALEPKPRNFTDASWQAAATDEQIKKIIKEGGPSVGKSPGMPGNPDLASKDDVVSELGQPGRSPGPGRPDR